MYRSLQPSVIRASRTSFCQNIWLLLVLVAVWLPSKGLAVCPKPEQVLQAWSGWIDLPAATPFDDLLPARKRFLGMYPCAKSEELLDLARAASQQLVTTQDDTLWGRVEKGIKFLHAELDARSAPGGADPARHHARCTCPNQPAVPPGLPEGVPLPSLDELIPPSVHRPQAVRVRPAPGPRPPSRREGGPSSQTRSSTSSSLSQGAGAKPAGGSSHRRTALPWDEYETKWKLPTAILAPAMSGQVNPFHFPPELLDYDGMLAHLRGAPWVRQVSRDRTILVGSSHKILEGPRPLGDVIDGFDDVIRFNSKVLPQYRDHMGSRTTVMVIGDFGWICNCQNGACCSPDQRSAFWQRVGMPEKSLVLSFDSFFASPVLKNPEAQGVPVETLGYPGCGPAWSYPCGWEQYVRASLLNHWLDGAQADHPGLRTRVPWGQHVRTGTQALLLLLAGGVRPALVGFDLGAEGNKHFYEQNSDFDNYVHETPILKELADAGLVEILGG
eukprot:jgi/Mesvir1/5997/Mv00746-RA.1